MRPPWLVNKFTNEINEAAYHGDFDGRPSVDDLLTGLGVFYDGIGDSEGRVD